MATLSSLTSILDSTLASVTKRSNASLISSSYSFESSNFLSFPLLYFDAIFEFEISKFELFYFIGMIILF